MNSIKKTSDGSSTIFVEELNEHYHSIHGAYNEALHVFIKSGIEYYQKKTIKIFEVGFGTGLNAYLSAKYSMKNDIIIEYQSIEKYPVEEKLILQLNYPEIVGNQNLFDKIHLTRWNQCDKVHELFRLKKIQGDLKNYSIKEQFDIIFFDAFAPEKQEKMWTKEIFIKMIDILKPNGILVTYCAKGSIRRRMVEVGFKVDRIPGPPGKREMLRATKV